MKSTIGTVLFTFCLLFALNLAWAEEPDWDLYDSLLKEVVVKGHKNGVPLNRVDYARLLSDARFQKVVEQLDRFPVSKLSGKQEKLAFNINAYNILAIKMILDHWPVSSIRDIGGLFSPVWKKTVGRIDGKNVTLHQVEHEILRPMGDPRIHMAIVCASVSCPDLRAEAFRAENLHHQLEQQTQQFVQNSAKGLRIEGNEIKVSKIFDWFEDDFDSQGGVKSFLSQYRNDLPPHGSVDADIKYDWSLNNI